MGRAKDILSKLAEAKGSGWGKFKQGPQVKGLKDISVGDILLTHSNQFDSKNVVKVTKIDPKGLFNGYFVKPENTKDKRQPTDREFSVWVDELKDDQYFKAVE
jgi:hypothetical protein